MKLIQKEKSIASFAMDCTDIGLQIVAKVFHKVDYLDLGCANFEERI